MTKTFKCLAAAAAIAAAQLTSLAQPHDDLGADLAAVRTHWQAGEVRAALAYAHLVAGEHPDSTEALAWLVLIEDRVGQGAVATVRLRDALRVRPADEHLQRAMRRLTKDREGCAATLRITRGEPGRFTPGRPAFALTAASGGPRLVPGLLTSGDDDTHARFDATPTIGMRSMLVFDSAGRLVAQGRDPSRLMLSSGGAALTPPSRGMSAEELYERLLPNVVQDADCD